MPLDKKPTATDIATLETAMQKMSILFRNTRMSDEQLDEYFDDLVAYEGFTYTVADLLVAIKKARQKFQEPGDVIPKVAFIMDRINPRV